MTQEAPKEDGSQPQTPLQEQIATTVGSSKPAEEELKQTVTDEGYLVEQASTRVDDDGNAVELPPSPLIKV